MTTLDSALLGPTPSWEVDDGLTMTRKIYRYGKLVSRITVEMIQDTPQVRPFKVGSVVGDRKHRPDKEDV
jgi:hypothetical protein